MKLTPTQEKVLQRLKEAQYEYKAPGFTSISSRILINGERYQSVSYGHVARDEDGTVYTRLDSRTVQSMAKKGAIEIIDLSEYGGLDTVRIIDFNYEVPYSELRQFDVVFDNDNTSTFFAPTDEAVTDVINHIETFWGNTVTSYEEKVVDVTTAQY